MNNNFTNPCLGTPPTPNYIPIAPINTQTATEIEIKKLIGNFVYFWNSTDLGNIWMFVRGVDSTYVYGCVLFRERDGRLYYYYIRLCLCRITNWLPESYLTPTHFQCIIADARCPNGEYIQVMCDGNFSISTGCRNGRPFVDCFRC